MQQEFAICVGLCLGMILVGELSRRLRARHPTTGRAQAQHAIESSVLALLGLLLAFTLSGAADRFARRRELTIEEVNAIGTAYLRLDLLPQAGRAATQGLVRRYLDARIATYRAFPDLAEARRRREQSLVLQAEIWRSIVEPARQQPVPIATVLMPALNSMFDIASTRIAMTTMHPPRVIFAMLNLVALLCAALLGLAQADSDERGKLHMAIFAVLVAGTIYIIRDIEAPRLGLIRVDAVDQLLIDLRRSLEPAQGQHSP